MNLKLNIQNILFLDIETVPQQERWEEVSTELQELYEAKTQYQRKEEFTAEEKNLPKIIEYSERNTIKTTLTNS